MSEAMSFDANGSTPVAERPQPDLATAHIGELIDICAGDYSSKLRQKAAAAIYARGQADAYAVARKITDAMAGRL